MELHLDPQSLFWLLSYGQLGALLLPLRVIIRVPPVPLAFTKTEYNNCKWFC